MTDQPPSSPQRGTGLAFVQHWQWVADKGLMRKNTAMGIKGAVTQILKLEEDWENVNVRTLDVDGLIARFRNISDLSPGSLGTYESRFRNGLESYQAYLDNPASYRPRRTRRPAGQREAGRLPRPGGAGSEDSAETPPTGGALTATGRHPGAGPVRLVVYPFPVRPDVFAELKLPADLTAEEVERMSAFLRAVALSGPGEQA